MSIQNFMRTLHLMVNYSILGNMRTLLYSLHTYVQHYNRTLRLRKYSCLCKETSRINYALLANYPTKHYL